MNIIANQEEIAKIQLCYDNIPLAVFLLGTNGSGKSSLRNYLNLSDIQTNIDPDVLNRIYKNKHPDSYQIESAKQALKMYDEALALGLNICLESTLAGHGTMQRIIQAKHAGYYTIAYFIGLNSVELNLERIAMRVRRGGHYISELVVRRRYLESVSNLGKVAPYLDLIHVLDNSLDHFRVQFSKKKAGLQLYNDLPEPWSNELTSALT